MDAMMKWIVVLVGVLVGAYHAWLAVKAIFVFRNNEPLSTWIFTLAGPLSTLPASVAGIVNMKTSGLWLIVGSVVSFIAAMVTAGSNADIDTAIWFLRTYSGPMFVLGILFSVLYYRQMKMDAANPVSHQESSPTTPSRGGRP